MLYLFWIGISMLAFPLNIKNFVYPRLISGTLSCLLLPFGVHKLRKGYYHPGGEARGQTWRSKGNNSFYNPFLPLLSSIYYKNSRLSPLGISGDLNVLSVFTLWYHCPPVSSLLGHYSSHLSSVSPLPIQLDSTHMWPPWKMPSKLCYIGRYCVGTL